MSLLIQQLAVERPQSALAGLFASFIGVETAPRTAGSFQSGGVFAGWRALITKSLGTTSKLIEEPLAQVKYPVLAHSRIEIQIIQGIQRCLLKNGIPNI